MGNEEERCGGSQLHDSRGAYEQGAEESNRLAPEEYPDQKDQVPFRPRGRVLYRLQGRRRPSQRLAVGGSQRQNRGACIGVGRGSSCIPLKRSSYRIHGRPVKAQAVPQSEKDTRSRHQEREKRQKGGKNRYK